MTKEDVMGKQSQLHPQTRENLLRAMRREAFAFARYLLYATQARQHGRQEVRSCSRRWPRRSTSGTSPSRPWSWD